jgi:phospholipase C
LSATGAAVAQIDPSTGSPYATLPEVAAVTTAGVPADLPNAPWVIEDYIAADKDTPVDLVHRYYQEQMQIDGGKMDMFVGISDAQGLSFGHYHTAGLPLAAEAKKGVLCDHFFHSAFGGSFLNHQWLITAATPQWAGAPDSIKATLDTSGKMTKDGAVTPDGYLINTIFTANTPHPSTVPAANLVPSIDMPTIGDRLNDKGIDWAWYSGGWNAALAGTIDPALQFQYHHQPFAYYKNYADGTPGRTAHLKDEDDFIAALSSGTLPPVSFVKFVGIDNEHPKYADVITGENHAVDVLNKIRASSVYKDAVVILTYDEHGGFFDHVAPPAGDKWGPGSRVPTIILSPFAKVGVVDSTVYETVSILSLIEMRWGLTPLGTRDGLSKPLTNAFDFTKSP